MHTHIQIIPIPAFEDNYIWLLHNRLSALVVDPGDAAPVLETLNKIKLSLAYILITHHHADHVGGVDALINAFPKVQVFAPKNEQYTFIHTAVSEPDCITLPIFNKNGLPLQFNVINVPGHTLDHIAYNSNDMLFCGDTLFSAGCGRLFEGTHLQMYHSLQKLAKLPKETLIYCTHEYTLKNVQFALTIEPNNIALQKRFLEVKTLREQQKPSLPSTLAIELATNPFLRCDVLVNNYHALTNNNLTYTAIDKFAEIRSKRNVY
jgi:hydroxyacylglutathione hydrolase